MFSTSVSSPALTNAAPAYTTVTAPLPFSSTQSAPFVLPQNFNADNRVAATLIPPKLNLDNRRCFAEGELNEGGQGSTGGYLFRNPIREIRCKTSPKDLAARGVCEKEVGTTNAHGNDYQKAIIQVPCKPSDKWHCLPS